VSLCLARSSGLLKQGRYCDKWASRDSRPFCCCSSTVMATKALLALQVQETRVGEGAAGGGGGKVCRVGGGGGQCAI
jgi:hypothetical protein